MTYYLPLLIVVLSNTVYHISTKSTPAGINTFASLSVSYLTAAAASLLIYVLTQKGGDLPGEYRQLNWSSFALGIAVVGLEAGFILMYKAGWSISTAQIVQSALLAVVLIFVGYLLYREPIDGRKVLGILVCMIGLYILNA